MKELRAVIFDYGGVLVRFQPDADLRRMEALAGLDPERFHALYWKHRAAYDLNELDGPAYWGTVARDAGRVLSPETVAALIAADTASWTHSNEPVVRWMSALQAAGVPTALLSNMGVELRAHVEGFSWIRACRVKTYSCDLRIKKPDLRIYQRCFEALGVDPGETLFLDDRPENVEGARAAGLRAWRFTTPVELARELVGEPALPRLAT